MSKRSIRKRRHRVAQLVTASNVTISFTGSDGKVVVMNGCDVVFERRQTPK